MIHKLFIDNVDINNFGGFIGENSYKSVLQFAEFKKVEKNVWEEEDGTEPDLSNVFLNSQNITLNIILDTDKLNDFIYLIKSSTYLEYDFETIDLPLNLRLVAFSNFRMDDKKSTITLNLSNDFPLNNYSYSAPTANKETIIKIDNIDLGKYGFTILNQTIQSIITPKSIKSHINMSNDFSVGGNYAEGTNYDEENTIKLNLLGSWSNLTDFWKNYKAFYYNLTKQNKRVLSFGNNNYNCYYQRETVNNFSLRVDKIFLNFSIELINF